MFQKVVSFFLLTCLFGTQLTAQKIYQKLDVQAQNVWVDSVFNALTLEQSVRTTLYGSSLFQ